MMKIMKRGRRAIFLKLVIFVFPISAWSDNSLLQVRPQNPEQEILIQDLRHFSDTEIQIARSKKFASRIHLQLDSSGLLQVEKPVVILIHGLFESPLAMQGLENLVASNGMHFINLRLPGHFEKDDSSLDRTPSFSWLRAAQKAYRFARRISKQTILIGHSTGGLVLSAVAAEHTQDKNKLILFAPAFGVSGISSLTSHIFTFFYISGWLLGHPQNDARYVSSWAGRRLEDLIGSLSNRNRGQDFSWLISNLRDEQVLWFDTSVDSVIDLDENSKLFARLKNINSSAQHIVLAENPPIKHRYLPAIDRAGQEKEKSIVEEFLQR